MNPLTATASDSSTPAFSVVVRALDPETGAVIALVRVPDPPKVIDQDFVDYAASLMWSEGLITERQFTTCRFRVG